MNKRAVGSEYERIAAEYLESCGYEILQKNYRCRIGEIDLIARSGECLCFVEVKFRRDAKKGGAAAAVHAGKQRRIQKAAQWYCMEQRISVNALCRYDVIAIDGEQVCLYKNAFGGF